MQDLGGDTRVPRSCGPKSSFLPSLLIPRCPYAAACSQPGLHKPTLWYRVQEQLEPIKGC